MDFIEYFRFLRHSIFVRTKTYTQKNESVFSIDYSKLKKDGVKLLIFDVDDTLTWNLGRLEEKTIALLKDLSKKFKIAIFSNCSKNRRKKLSIMLSGLDIYIVPIGGKPGKQGFLHTIGHFRIKPENIAMIGDRMGTDIWGAYVTNIKERVLVKGYLRS